MLATGSHTSNMTKKALGSGLQQEKHPVPEFVVVNFVVPIAQTHCFHVHSGSWFGIQGDGNTILCWHLAEHISAHREQHPMHNAVFLWLFAMRRCCHEVR
jgi:hypothetical protein